MFVQAGCDRRGIGDVVEKLVSVDKVGPVEKTDVHNRAIFDDLTSRKATYLKKSDVEFFNTIGRQDVLPSDTRQLSLGIHIDCFGAGSLSGSGQKLIVATSGKQSFTWLLCSYSSLKCTNDAE